MRAEQDTGIHWENDRQMLAEFEGVEKYFIDDDGNKIKRTGVVIHNSEHKPEFTFYNPDTKQEEFVRHKFFCGSDGKIYAKAQVELGYGSFGRVTLCQDKDKKLYVVKEIKKTSKGPLKEIADEFKKEAGVLGDIGELKDHYECGGFFTVVMEYKGQWLRGYLKKLGNNASFEQECDLSIDAANEVLKLHRDKNYAHLDIKAENFTIDENEKIHLIDFGLSKKIEGEQKLIGGTHPFLPTRKQCLDISYQDADCFALMRTLVMGQAVRNNLRKYPKGNIDHVQIMREDIVRKNRLLSKIFDNAHAFTQIYYENNPELTYRYPTALQLKVALILLKYNIQLSDDEINAFLEIKGVDDIAQKQFHTLIFRNKSRNWNDDIEINAWVLTNIEKNSELKNSIELLARASLLTSVSIGLLKSDAGLFGYLIKNPKLLTQENINAFGQYPLLFRSLLDRALLTENNFSIIKKSMAFFAKLGKQFSSYEVITQWLIDFEGQNSGFVQMMLENNFLQVLDIALIEKHVQLFGTLFDLKLLKSSNVDFIVANINLLAELAQNNFLTKNNFAHLKEMALLIDKVGKLGLLSKENVALMMAYPDVFKSINEKNLKEEQFKAICKIINDQYENQEEKVEFLVAAVTVFNPSSLRFEEMSRSKLSAASNRDVDNKLDRNDVLILQVLGDPKNYLACQTLLHALEKIMALQIRKFSKDQSKIAICKKFLPVLKSHVPPKRDKLVVILKEILPVISKVRSVFSARSGGSKSESYQTTENEFLEVKKLLDISDEQWKSLLSGSPATVASIFSDGSEKSVRKNQKTQKAVDEADLLPSLHQNKLN